ncbi:MAG: phosphoribosylformylglycinamidine synthase subunit PurQ, partial [Chloroflexota bacterium]|nr:phosphoribosylformylglycinamidine synthase subunit PurQ [Chloroflexota bacterium]
AMLRNQSLQFRCEWVHMRVEQTDTPFTSEYRSEQIVQMPIAHGEGNYYADAGKLADLERRGQIVFRYCDSQGRVTAAANPNGALANIAGICNEQRNVVGLMPHPERCSEALLGGSDGRPLWQSAVQALVAAA